MKNIFLNETSSIMWNINKKVYFEKEKNTEDNELDRKKKEEDLFLLNTFNGSDGKNKDRYSIAIY